MHLRFLGWPIRMPGFPSSKVCFEDLSKLMYCTFKGIEHIPDGRWCRCRKNINHQSELACINRPDKPSRLCRMHLVKSSNASTSILGLAFGIIPCFHFTVIYFFKTFSLLICLTSGSRKQKKRHRLLSNITSCATTQTKCAWNLVPPRPTDKLHTGFKGLG